MDLATVLSSGVVAGLVAGLVTLRTTERKIAIENVTQQRQLWREKIRDIALRINNESLNPNRPKLGALYIELQLLLNPNDEKDKSILDTVWEMAQEGSGDQLNIVLGEKLALLLKHDWERAKNEAKPMWFRCGRYERVRYENFRFKRQ